MPLIKIEKYYMKLIEMNELTCATNDLTSPSFVTSSEAIRSRSGGST